MLGFNGGLIGKARDTTATQSVPGVWTPLEQIKARRALLWPGPLRDDASYSSVSLLLPGDGSNGSTSILDRSPSPRTATIFGNTSISTTQSKYYGSSIGFDGNGDYLSYAPDSVFSFGAGDFTIECWFYSASATAQGIFDNLNTGGLSGFTAGRLYISVSSDRKLRMFISGPNVHYSTSTTYSANTWTHLAACRSGTTAKLFINGSEGYSGTHSTSFSQNYCTVGRDIASGGGEFANGYISDLRITKGVARYTANFTPPNSFLL